MREIVKYILIVGLACLAYCHTREWTNFTMALYFNTEYMMLGSVIMYLASITKGVERLFFSLLTVYFGLKIVYNTLLYIEQVGVKLGLYNSEFWGFVVTVVIIAILLIMQFMYVLDKKR